VIAALAAAVALAAPGVDFKAVIAAPTHRPVARLPWAYCVIAVEPRTVRPLRARVHLRIQQEGRTVGQVGRHVFYGAWCESIRWPRSARGDALVLQAIVTVGRRQQTANFAIRVR
jgi:hypothetical protein